MRKTGVLIGTILTIALCVGAFTACGKDNEYYSDLSKASFWDNKGNQSIAQNHVYDIAIDFLKDGKENIVVNADGNVVGENGKIKKVAFFGFDGARADLLYNILPDTSGVAKNVDNAASEYSGIALAKSTGGLYHAYAGGETGKESEQSTSTSAGWTSELTGYLHNTHGVKENDNTMNENVNSIMKGGALLGLNTSLIFNWSTYFDLNLRNEINFLAKNPSVAAKTKYILPKRKLAANEAELRAALGIDNDDDYDAGTLDIYNYTANEKYDANVNLNSDTVIRDYMIDRIMAGDDFVGGIFSAPDGAGHTQGFANENHAYVNSIRNSDNYAYQIMQEIQKRELASNEEWLVLITADHGGNGTGHGRQTLEAKNIFLASNKPVNEKYFRKNFNGFKEN